jgi:cell wall-associated NlpC family hydrolase
MQFAESQVQAGGTPYVSGGNSYCEQFVEDAYNTPSRYGNPLDLINQVGGFSSNSPPPGVIAVFGSVSNGGPWDNGGNGHAAIYMGNGQMIGVAGGSIRWARVADWGAPLYGYVYPPASWPGNPNGISRYGNGGYCNSVTVNSTSSPTFRNRGY